MIVALLLLAFAAPVIETETVAPDHYRLTLSAPAMANVEEGRAALLPTAQRLCGALAVRFGSFQFGVPERKDSPVGAVSEPVQLQQQLFCGAPQAAPRVPAMLAGPAWQPDEADQQAVAAATYAYFAAKDEGRHAEAHAFLSPRMQTMSPLPEWRASLAAFNAKAGPVRARRIAALTWYANPPGASEPGIYAAADYVGAFANVEFLCGYVVWRMQAEGGFRLVREEQNMLGRDSAKKVTSLDRAQLRARMGCKD